VSTPLSTPKKPNANGLWRNTKGQYVWVENMNQFRYVTLPGFKMSNSLNPVSILEDDYWEKAEFPARITNTFITNPTPEHSRRFLHG